MGKGKTAGSGTLAWRIYVGLMVPVVVAYHLHLANAGPVFNAIGLSSVVAILIAVVRYAPRPRLPWFLFAAGQLLFVTGDVLAYNYTRFFHAELPFPSIADPFYLAVYPTLIAGLLILIRRRRPGRDWSGLLDSVIITTALGVLSWEFLMEPYARDPSLGLQTKLISIAYPLMDILLLGVFVRLAVGGGKRERPFQFLFASLTALLTTDTIYGWKLLHGGYTTGGKLDLGWMLFYLLWGAAALHPSMVTLSERAPDAHRSMSRLRIGFITAAVVVVPTIDVADRFQHEGNAAYVTVAGSAIIFALVIVRLIGLVRQTERLATNEAALREAGAELVTATNRLEIYAAALRAAGFLMPAGSHVAVFEGEEPISMQAVASDVAGARLSDVLRTASGWEVSQLAEGRSVEVGRGPRSRTIKLYVVPIVVRKRTEGAIVAGSRDQLALPAKDGLDALAAQVALALESAALTEDLLRRQGEARFRSLVQNSSDVVAIVDSTGLIKYVSPAVKAILGYDPAFLEGKSIRDMGTSDDSMRLASALEHCSAGRSEQIEFSAQHADGGTRSMEAVLTNLVSDPNVQGIIINGRDVSDRKAFEDELARQAFTDSITGLANRALFRDRLDHALAQRREGSTAVFFLDLDDFKTVNDSLGHAAGDILLKQVGARLEERLRAGDTAARLGGDEFAILMEGSAGEWEVRRMAERILDAFTAPFIVEDREVFATTCIGVASTGDAIAGGEDLLRNADVAMYTAKQIGKGRYQIFEPHMHADVLRRLELKADLNRAMEKDEFFLQYQPIVDMESGEVVGAEALIRWAHPERGLIPPLEFIALAEETGTIIPLGEWVLRTACNDMAELTRRHPERRPLTISLNISPRQLQETTLVDHLREALRDSGLEPGRLVLEITEGVLIEDVDAAVARLSDLKRLGVQLAIDDFGTGYSSLNYLRAFPVDILKLDKTFIDGISDGEMAALTRKILEIAAILNLKAIAEGVEEVEQVQRLLQLGGTYAQGYYFARPMSIDAFEGVVSGPANVQTIGESEAAGLERIGTAAV